MNPREEGSRGELGLYLPAAASEIEETPRNCRRLEIFVTIVDPRIISSFAIVVGHDVKKMPCVREDRVSNGSAACFGWFHLSQRLC